METGRYQNIELSRRICTICRQCIEDEFHFILVCPKYKELRVKFIKKYYWSRPSVFKFIELLSLKNIKQLTNLGKYIFNAFKIRDNIT